MGKGSTVIEKLNPSKKYYNLRLEDEARYPGKNFIVVPLFGWSDDDYFFYLCKKDDALEIMGEFYIVDREGSVKRCQEETAAIKQVRFHATAPNGESFSREDAEEFLRDLLGSKYSDEYVHNKG